MYRVVLLRTRICEGRKENRVSKEGGRWQSRGVDSFGPSTPAVPAAPADQRQCVKHCQQPAASVHLSGLSLSIECLLASTARRGGDESRLSMKRELVKGQRKIR